MRTTLPTNSDGLGLILFLLLLSSSACLTLPQGSGILVDLMAALLLS